jgi:redox-regulated HSP33 family molecular chaperone
MSIGGMFGGSKDETTKLQDRILSEYDMGVSNPNQIAANCDCSASYVRETLNEYRSGWDEDDGFGIF